MEKFSNTNSLTICDIYVVVFIDVIKPCEARSPVMFSTNIIKEIRNIKNSWKIMLKMYIFLLQSLSVKTNSDFTWRTARLYQVREYIPVPGCI